jgi:hypothetical protein
VTVNDGDAPRTNTTVQKKQRAETYLLRPFSHFDVTGKSSAPHPVATSVLARPFGLDRRFMIPTAAPGNFAEARRVEVDGCIGFFVARPDGRARPDRELIDLCGSVMEARIHYRLSC